MHFYANYLFSHAFLYKTHHFTQKRMQRYAFYTKLWFSRPQILDRFLTRLDPYLTPPPIYWQGLAVSGATRTVARGALGAAFTRDHGFRIMCTTPVTTVFGS